ncbi:hypothetical protein ACFYO5_00550 [Streptomyces sp. NPDC006259]|uniref:hypothetical protein n=1 Tax=Streptomyces sp. NPDC006259 TaxID=3364740 RepID=UPI0036CFFA98
MRLRQIDVAAGTSGPFRGPTHAQARDIGRDTLPAGDGWASYGGTTTGGAAADDDHVHTVTDRAGLVRALDHGSDTPEIIRIAGTIDADTDDDGLDRADHATGGYSLKKYLAAHSPRTWGSASPTGPQEEARQAPAARHGYPGDLLAIRNAYDGGSERDLTADVGWTPTLHTVIDSAAVADREVARGAGAGRIP